MTPGREPDEAQIVRNERAYNRLMARLSTEQQLAVIDLALDLRPPWFRRALLKIPLTSARMAAVRPRRHRGHRRRAEGGVKEKGRPSGRPDSEVGLQ